MGLCLPTGRRGNRIATRNHPQVRIDVSGVSDHRDDLQHRAGSPTSQSTSSGGVHETVWFLCATLCACTVLFLVVAVPALALMAVAIFNGWQTSSNAVLVVGHVGSFVLATLTACLYLKRSV
ncbi:hypothetical protein HPB50_004861 [Hyalomma asiaticum]|uniref:Uncharacterized protein n=1 Tax=Hyalomma asiaticum TaxID=266040 RepID=A0ACB7SBU0_HYAAI|nr:hypothetical protein HPB50_004861 [Hyalomma asiaticum]